MSTRLLRQRTQDVVGFVNAHRFPAYILVSLAAVSVVIFNALKRYSNFYSVAIYLSKSSRGVLVLANFGFLISLLGGHIVQRIFFGPLRANEVERLYDRLWFFITESLLAFTIFRDEFDAPFVVMFGFLLFVKSFHWLVSDRIEWMDQQPYPGPPLLFHFRMVTLFLILWLTDLVTFTLTIEHTLSVGVGGMVLFASEYGILLASIMNTIAKYLLSTYDLRRAGRRGGENAPAWENKSMWLFYIELTTDFLKLSTYLVFFIVIMAFYGLPLNIVRDVYITARSFITRLRALHRYQAATKNMDQRYPNATEAELAAMTDRTCIICREEMSLPAQRDASAGNDGPNTTPKKLPCGHFFHFHCLRSWLERQQSCPTCRRNVLENVPAAPGTAGAGPAPAAVQQGNGPIDPNGNNPLRHIARLIAYGQPINRPANQEAQGGQGQQQPVNQAQGQRAGQQAPIVINYQVQYQFPQDRGAAPPSGQAQPLQPVQPFSGFEGPGGGWQPWPAQGPATPTPTTTSTSVVAEADGSQSPAQESAAQVSTSPDIIPESVSGIEPTESQVEGVDLPAQSPREAAALAAMKRLGKQPVQSTTPPSAPSTSADTASTSAPQRPPPISISSSKASIQTTSPPPKVPELIPLWHLPTAAVSHTAPSSIPTSAQRFTFSAARSTFGPQTPAPALSQLPPSITQEQLLVLDRLTREAIDERLRILEGVSTTVYRCIDELMRLRSALPASSTNPSVPAATTPILPSQERPPSSSAGPSDAGRGKQRQEEPSDSAESSWSFDDSDSA